MHSLQLGHTPNLGCESRNKYYHGMYLIKQARFQQNHQVSSDLSPHFVKFTINLRKQVIVRRLSSD